MTITSFNKPHKQQSGFNGSIKNVSRIVFGQKCTAKKCVGFWILWLSETEINNNNNSRIFKNLPKKPTMKCKGSATHNEDFANEYSTNIRLQIIHNFLSNFFGTLHFLLNFLTCWFAFANFNFC